MNPTRIRYLADEPTIGALLRSWKSHSVEVERWHLASLQAVSTDDRIHFQKAAADAYTGKVVLKKVLDKIFLSQSSLLAHLKREFEFAIMRSNWTEMVGPTHQEMCMREATTIKNLIEEVTNG